MPTEEKVNEGIMPETEVTDISQTTDVTPVEEKSLLQEIGEWIVLALIIGLIWKLCNLVVGGVKKLVKKFKDKRAAKKAAKEAAGQPAVAAPVATVTPQENSTEETENK